MSTLVTDLDDRIAKSPKFKSKTVAEHFQKSDLTWWKTLSRKKSYREQENAIATWLSKLCLKNVLELGPGFGRVTRLIQMSGAETLVLVEVNRSVLGFLNKEFPDAYLVNVDVSGYTYKAKSFNLIVAAEILVHIPDIETLLKKIHIALKSSGSAIVSITPLSWYKKNVKGQTMIHRGIDQYEFEKFISQLFAIKATHQSSNGQQLSYWLKKKTNRD